jgi:hypothetical protein
MHPAALGWKRAQSVARVLRETLQFDAEKIDLPSRSYVMAPVSAYLKKLDASQGVSGMQLDFLPACPHDSRCQMGDPLYIPPAPK